MKPLGAQGGGNYKGHFKMKHRYEFGKPVSVINTYWRLFLCAIFGHGDMLCGHCYYCGKKLT